jgi:hypothetical protein
MKKLLRVTALAMAIGLSTPVSGVAQGGPAVGERVRVHRADGRVVIGTVERVSSEEVVVGDSALSVDGIESIERSLGERRRFARNLAITTGVAAGAGGLISAISWSPCRETGFLACLLHPESRSDAFAWGFVGGGILGLPLGIIIGLAEKDERWEPIARPAVGRVSLGLVTGGGRGVGVRASIPFGGHSR